jgi:hypothetical protein
LPAQAAVVVLKSAVSQVSIAVPVNGNILVPQGAEEVSSDPAPFATAQNVICSEVAAVAGNQHPSHINTQHRTSNILAQANLVIGDVKAALSGV